MGNFLHIKANVHKSIDPPLQLLIRRIYEDGGSGGDEEFGYVGLGEA